LRDFCSKYEEGGSGTRTELEALRQKLMEAPPAVLMRRYKADHLAGLPDLEVHRVHQPMPERQAREYSAVAEQARGSRDRGAILAALHQLRAVSLHPMGSIGADDDHFISSSARWRYAFTILEEIRRLRQKAVIFLDSLAHQSFLAELVHRKFELNQAPVVISGEVAGESRKRLVDSFQQRAGFDVLIMSPRAGGVGLTVTAANHVIHLSRWWNPAVEDQCTDRVYRIGQTRPVHVYVPMAIHPAYGLSSFDVKLDELLSEKRALSRALLAPPTISEAELGRLFAETIGGGADTGS
jgi:SNF2 family DNA or RNA helicase